MVRTISTVVAVVVLGSPILHAQPLFGLPPAPPGIPRTVAPVDLTGVWVSVVTEDWRWRMMTPAPGDYAGVPLTDAGRALADQWDWERDAASGEACRGYAAPAIMRQPTRVRISWEDEFTLLVETDAGQQTRRLQFQRPDAAPLTSPMTVPTQRSWQGFSVANWESLPLGIYGGGFILGPPGGGLSGTLEVHTTQIRPGYLRKNGVPFSEDTTVTEYFTAWQEPGGQQWFTVMTIVADPRYLREPFITTSDFKKERDMQNWDSLECQVR